MKIQDKWDNYGEMCTDCQHARKFHWETMPYGDIGPIQRDKNPEMKCVWGLEIGKCEQKICGCRKRKHDFCVIGGI